jgi:hypothetical protein
MNRVRRRLEDGYQCLVVAIALGSVGILTAGATAYLAYLVWSRT